VIDRGKVGCYSGVQPQSIQGGSLCRGRLNTIRRVPWEDQHLMELFLKRQSHDRPPIATPTFRRPCSFLKDSEEAL
jgi:hypothetical protein